MLQTLEDVGLSSKHCSSGLPATVPSPSIIWHFTFRIFLPDPHSFEHCKRVDIEDILERVKRVLKIHIDLLD